MAKKTTTGKKTGDRRQKTEGASRRGGSAGHPDEALFRAVYDQAPLGIALVDAATGRWLQVNRRYAEILGRTPEEMVGLQVVDLSHPDEVQADLHYLERFKAGELETFSRDKRYLRPDGSAVWVNLTVTKLWGEDGVSRTNLSLAQDVTARVVAEEALRATRHRLEATLNALPDLLFEMDGEGIIRDFRAPDPQKLYVPSEQFLGRRMRDVLPPEVVVVIDAAVAEAAATGTHHGATYALPMPGGVRWFELSITRRTEPVSGNVVFTVLVRDITEREQAQAALAQSREQLALAIEGSGIGLWDWHVQTGAVVLNERWAEIVGYTLEELAPTDITTWNRLCHPDDLEASTRSLTAHFEGRAAAYECEARMRHKDGRWVWVMDRGKVTEWDADGKPLRMTGTHLDITARKLAELTLRESEEQFRILFDSGSDAVFVHPLGPDGRPGRFVEVNAVASRMLGYSREELLTRRPDDLAVVLRPGAVQERSVALLDKGVTVFEEMVVAKDGRHIPIEFSTQLLQFRGRPHLLSIGRDISERKRLEEERLILGKLESTGVLAGGIAHDFNNLLAALLSYLGLARTQAVPGSKLAQHLDAAEKVAWTARDLTREFITFSKGGAPVRKLTRLGPLVEDAVTLSLRGSAVAGDVVVAPDLWPAEVDGPQVAQAVRNLLLNARDAMPGGGRVLVRVENATAEQVRNAGLPAGDFVRICVIDRGAGIAAEHLARIFDPYFTTKPRGGERGLGLGLTICRSIVERHGGAITVATEPRRGSTFEAYLPARPAAGSEPSPARGPATRVLVMDDDETLRAVTGEVLAFLGYDVELAEDGARAVERWGEAAAAGRPFDVALLDLVVSGGMGGVATLAALRAIDPTACAVLVSGHPDDPAMLDAARHGFAAALPRPYAADTLHATLRAVLDR